jgi:cobalt-zinc-cadmium efflux system membrane fusion protein
MNAEVMVKNQQANVLPEEAILQYSNRKYVFVQTDSLHYSMREVQTGTTENGYTVVSGAGITPADQVVIKGSYTLLMMLKNKQED